VNTDRVQLADDWGTVSVGLFFYGDQLRPVLTCPEPNPDLRFRPRSLPPKEATP